MMYKEEAGYIMGDAMFGKGVSGREGMRRKGIRRLLGANLERASPGNISCMFLALDGVNCLLDCDNCCFVADIRKSLLFTSR